MKSWLKTGCCLCSFGLFVSQRGCNSLLPDYHQSCKQCICSHKYSKQTSSVTAGSLFLLVGGSRPQTPFRRISFCGCAPFRRYSLPSFGEFLKSGEIGTPAKSQPPPVLDKIFSKALTGISVCVIMMKN